MSEPSADHTTFDIERRFAAAPERVFEAWADPTQKQQWFACHDEWRTAAYHLDFRVGGREHNSVAVPGEQHHVYDAVYFDIVPGARIVYAYEMRLGERRISVSLATVVFARHARGTSMRFTEQAVFLDGYAGGVDRKRGTEEGLERLQRLLG